MNGGNENNIINCNCKMPTHQKSMIYMQKTHTDSTYFTAGLPPGAIITNILFSYIPSNNRNNGKTIKVRFISYGSSNSDVENDEVEFEVNKLHKVEIEYYEDLFNIYIEDDLINFIFLIIKWPI